MGKRKIHHDHPSPQKCATQNSTSISDLPPEMLVQVLHHLSMDDLKNTRLVNKTWSQVAVAPMREKSRVFRCPPLDLDRKDSVDDLHDVLSRCLKKGDFPLDKFFIRLFSVIGYRHSLVSMKKITLDSLFQMISPFVTELSLGMKGLGNNLNAENLPKKHNFPKLKHLHIHFAGCSEFGYMGVGRLELWNGYTGLVREIVEGAGKLESITLEVAKGGKNKAIVNQFIMDVFPNGRKVDLLTHFEVTLMDEDYFDWTALSTVGLKLRQLNLNLSRLALSNNLLWTFLESQSKSLVYLKLRPDANDWIGKVPPNVELPRLEKLEVLELKYDGHLIKFPDINYQKLLPSLKQIHLCVGAHWQDFLKEGLAPSETLEELRFSRKMYLEVDTAAAARIREIFPNLKRLQIYDDLAMVTAVYQNLPHLEELTLVMINFYSFNFNEIITGLTEAECSNSKRLSRLLLQKLEISKANRESLGCLQKLHTLRIRKFHEGNGGGIVPVPVSEVFYMVEPFPKQFMAVLSAMDSLKRIDFFGGEKLPPTDQLKPNEKKFLDTLKERFVVL